LEQHRAALAVDEQDAPMRVLVLRACHDLLDPLLHIPGQRWRKPDQQQPKGYGNTREDAAHRELPYGKVPFRDEMSGREVTCFRLAKYTETVGDVHSRGESICRRR